MFISFEGIDGSGKSTQARLLAEALRAEAHEVVLTREPGGSPGAEEIRRLLVEGRADRWSAETELLLFTAARRDHLERTILPALDRGIWVVSDRFADSTRVYQAAARGHATGGIAADANHGAPRLPRGDLAAMIEALHRLMIGISPDRTFVIDLDPAEAMARTASRQPAAAAAAAEDRFETMGLGFQTRLRDGFRALAQADPARIRLIDGSGQPDIVAARVRAAL